MPKTYRCSNCGQETNYLPEVCPKCGLTKSLTLERDIRDSSSSKVFSNKSGSSSIASSKSRLEIDLGYYGRETSDQDLKNGIQQSLRDLAQQESGTGWGKLSLMLSGDTPDWMTVKMLKAIVDQNKIIIRQNERLLRAIKENQTKS
jgi:hypothetical protein